MFFSGLIRVVEFRSEDGCSCCFLCHCCRIRSTKNDLIDHLTSSSHLVNYLVGLLQTLNIPHICMITCICIIPGGKINI